MGKNNEVPSGFMAYVRGDIAEHMGDMQEDIQEGIARLEAERQGLEEGNHDVIRGIITQMIAEEEKEEETGIDVPDISQIINFGRVEHGNMPLLALSSRARIPAWLHGEAGSGKSTAAERIAEQEGVDFRSISMCPTTSKSDLLGYRDATGNYRRSAFRDTYENGGVFLFDEIDNSHPSSLALMNHSLANGIAEFPDGEVEIHPDTIIIAAANTLGRGANAQYVGRAVIDAATRDRFVYIPWDIDDRLEEAIATGKAPKGRDMVDVSEGGIPSAKSWLKTVRQNREAINEVGIRHLCSPRATIYGITLAKLGMGEKWLEELCIYKGMGESDREKIRTSIDGQGARKGFFGRNRGGDRAGAIV